MDTELLITFLTNEGYPSYLLDRTISKINSLSPNVAIAFDRLIEGEVPEIEVEGFSYKVLINDYRMKPVGAILALDWLSKEPDVAREAIVAPRK